MVSWLEHLLQENEVTYSTLCWIPISGSAWSLYRSATLLRAVCAASATKNPFGLFVIEKGFLSHLDMTFEYLC